MIEVFVGVLAALVAHDALRWFAQAYDRRARLVIHATGYWGAHHRTIRSDLRRFVRSFRYVRPLGWGARS